MWCYIYSISHPDFKAWSHYRHKVICQAPILPVFCTILHFDQYKFERKNGPKQDIFHQLGQCFPHCNPQAAAKASQLWNLHEKPDTLNNGKDCSLRPKSYPTLQLFGCQLTSSKAWILWPALAQNQFQVAKYRILDATALAFCVWFVCPDPHCMRMLEQMGE